MLDGKSSFYDALYVTITIFMLKVIIGAWDQLYHTYITPIYKEKLHHRIQLEMFEKARKVELSKYDDPIFYNDFIMSMQFTDSYFMTAITNISGILSNILMFSSIFKILIDIDVYVCSLVFISSCLSSFFNRKLKKVKFDESLAFAENTRKNSYIERVFKLADYAKELRMTNFKECLDNKYDEYSTEFNNLTKYFGKKKLLWENFTLLNVQIVYGIIIGVLLYKLAITGTITLGEFTVVMNASIKIRETLKRITDYITELPIQSNKMEVVRTFISNGKEKEKIKHKKIPNFESIEFRNVSFGYTDENKVLYDLSLSIKKNEKIAIVGYNGAGKSTFVKLLLGLLQPDNGTIFYNGIDIREFEPECYRQKISAVFQDYKIFAASLAENVLGDVFSESQEDTVNNLLHLVNFDRDVSIWCDGIHTILSREFDEKGRNLSGGEAQKIAIARAFAKNGELIVLDEPSSAIDPIFENELNTCILKYSEGRTAVFISHRLSTAVNADRIYMLDDGHLIETGTHRELMRKNGKYAEIFQVQSEKYIY